jgi:uncharacterized protein YdhG (YjbR/CyaY superfamily)
MQSKATTVQAYLSSLPADRREAIEQVREVILASLDKDYEEGMAYGMIGYSVPHRIFPAGYHADPRQGLMFAALASQKNFMSVYVMGLYTGCDWENESELVQWFREAWAKSGKKKLDMGKACIRFKKVDDLPLDVLGEVIRRIPAKVYVENYVNARRAIADAGGARKAAEKRRKSA